MMTEKFKILGQFIKDMSSETKDAETYIFVKDNILKYQLNINIISKPLKNKMAEVSITTKFKEADDNQKNSYFEMIYAVIVKIDEDVNTKEVLEPIFLKEVPTEVYPKIERIFLDLLNHSGYPNVKFESKVDFNELYKKRGN